MFKQIYHRLKKLFVKNSITVNMDPSIDYEIINNNQDILDLKELKNNIRKINFYVEFIKYNQKKNNLALTDIKYLSLYKNSKILWFISNKSIVFDIYPVNSDLRLDAMNPNLFLEWQEVNEIINVIRERFNNDTISLWYNKHTVPDMADYYLLEYSFENGRELELFIIEKYEEELGIDMDYSDNKANNIAIIVDLKNI